jgi:Leucine-rich repeat (LRR) protein
MYLQAFKNLKKLDISHNNIVNLPGPQVFKGMASLKFLYLHNNKIAKW